MSQEIDSLKAEIKSNQSYKTDLQNTIADYARKHEDLNNQIANLQ